MHFDINHSSILFDPPPRIMTTKANQWDLIKSKSFHTAKETIKKKNQKDNPQNGRKSLQTIQQTKAYSPEYTNSSYNSTTTKKTQLKNKQKI